jgi:tetratricopeptide (TPR) repeat protein
MRIRRCHCFAPGEVAVPLSIRFAVAAVAILGFTIAAEAKVDQRLRALCKSGTTPEEIIDACTKRIPQAAQENPLEQAAPYINRAVQYERKKQCDLAVSDLTRVAELLPPSHIWHYNAILRRASVWSDCAGDSSKAFADLAAAIRLQPKQAAAYSNRGRLLNLEGKYEKALEDLEVARRLDNKSFLAYSHTGMAYLRSGNYDKAISFYSTSIDLNGKDFHPWMNRGEAWRFKGDLNKSLEDLTRAIALSPRSSIALSKRGETYRYMGDYQHASADFNLAIEITPNFAYAYTGRGLTYEKMGDETRARADFRQSLDVDDPTLDTNKAAHETASARLAALDSGEAPPVIAPVLAKTASSAVPTLVVTPPKPAAVPEGGKKSTIPQGRRVALVIGNSAYKTVPALRNPESDAKAVATSLRNLGFDSVKLINDATREVLIDSLRAFANEAENADWALVYYAGHGMEVGGVNYLIPTDAKLAVDRDIEFEAVPVTQVLSASNAARKLKLVLLDACRDNPFAPRKTAAPEAVSPSASTAGATIASRSIGRGLAEVKVGGGTLVVFAAKDGQVALDGEGGNSPFAVAVVQRVATPGIEINKLFRLVRDDVMEATAGRQEPYTYGSLPGKEDFFFVAK